VKIQPTSLSIGSGVFEIKNDLTVLWSFDDVGVRTEGEINLCLVRIGVTLADIIFGVRPLVLTAKQD